MPQYEGKDVLTIGKADECRRVAEEWFAALGWDDVPRLHKPGHEGPMWVLSLEGGPEDWPLLISGSIGDQAATWPDGVFAEPVTSSWCLGLYPVGKPDTPEALVQRWDAAVTQGSEWAQQRVGADMARYLRDH